VSGIDLASAPLPGFIAAWSSMAGEQAATMETA